MQVIKCSMIGVALLRRPLKPPWPGLTAHYSASSNLHCLFPESGLLTSGNIRSPDVQISSRVPTRYLLRPSIYMTIR
jgi:hypothetical protein